MTPALFALVDAVLAQEANESRFWRSSAMWESRLHGRDRLRLRIESARFKVARSHLGWWRSLWPLGGGA